MTDPKKPANWSIRTPNARNKLPPRREPYWFVIRTGLEVGYRKMTATSDGTWLARRRMTGESRETHSLGRFVDDPTTKQVAFDDARRAAEAWSTASEAGVQQHNTTVEAACRAYVEHLLAEKGKASSTDAAGRFKRLVYGTQFGLNKLEKLTAQKVRAWRNDQIPKDHDDEDEDAERRAKDSVNRNLASLKAALNLAYRDRLVATDAAWKHVEKFTGVDSSRKTFLTGDERTALLKACPPEFGSFAQALLLTALRPGELAHCTVADLDTGSRSLTIRKSKVATARRTVPLSSAAFALLEGMAGGRPPAQPLAPTDLGRQWNKDTWQDPMRAAVKAAGLPVEVTVYGLRHTAISALLAGGMSIFVVSKIAGTSVEMIERNYGHLNDDRVREQMDVAQGTRA